MHTLLCSFSLVPFHFLTREAEGQLACAPKQQNEEPLTVTLRLTQEHGGIWWKRWLELNELSAYKMTNLATESQPP